MAATVRNLRGVKSNKSKKSSVDKKKIKNKGVKMSGNDESGVQKIPEVSETPANDFLDFNDLDFVDHYGEDKITDDSLLLAENTARTAISCGFVGLGGGGGKAS